MGRDSSSVVSEDDVVVRPKAELQCVKVRYIFLVHAMKGHGENGDTAPPFGTRYRRVVSFTSPKLNPLRNPH
jgi:hypothetical protein